MTTQIATRDEQAVFLAFDRLDDDQIIQEMKGAALQEYVYQFEEGGRRVMGLSKAGTDDASRIMAVKYGEVLRELDVTLEFQDEAAGYFKATVGRYSIRADGREVELDRAIGQKRQSKSIPNSAKANQFWYEQGGQKALRNAKQKLIPETIKQAIIAAYVEQGKVRTIKAEDVVGEPLVGAVRVVKGQATEPVLQKAQTLLEQKRAKLSELLDEAKGVGLPIEQWSKQGAETKYVKTLDALIVSAEATIARKQHEMDGQRDEDDERKEP